ncbi:MAG TPA: hypothetical protein PLZ47_07595 [Candidatus Cloacimonas acidaminovorans]|nr:hypothetical protein [Candidatus Cloacimonas acidaminovorans]
MLLIYTLCAGLKSVVIICRSCGTLSDTTRYVVFIYSFHRVKIRR